MEAGPQYTTSASWAASARYFSRTVASPYLRSRRRTTKWPRAIDWKWSMKIVLTVAPPTAPISGTSCAAAFSVTVIE